MYGISPAEFTAEGTADIPVNEYTPLWGCPVGFLSDNNLKFCSELYFTLCTSCTACAKTQRAPILLKETAASSA